MPTKINLKSVIPYLTILIVGILLYARTLNYELVFLDDNRLLVDLKWFFQDFSNSLKVFTQPDLLSKLFYRPLVFFSVMTDAAIGGGDLFMYRLTNLLIHLVNASLVFVLFNNLQYSFGKSLFGALVFVVHPILTQAVVWIPARADTLLSLFVLASFISFVVFLEAISKSLESGGSCRGDLFVGPSARRGSSHSRNPRGTRQGSEGILKRSNMLWLCAHSALLMLALLTKETAIVLPLACVGYWVCFKRGDVKFASMTKVFLSWAGVLGVWLTVRHMILSGVSNPSKLQLSTVIQSMFENAPAIISYIGKIFWPINVSVLPILKDLSLVYGVVTGVIFIVFLFFSKTKRMPSIVFGSFWFFIFLAPSLVIAFLFSEYKIYLPMVGALMMILEVIPKFDRKKGMALAGIVLCLLAAKSFTYSERFQGRWVFWKSAVKTSPHSPLAHRNLGAMYYLENKLDEAETHYKQALILNEREPMVHNNLGLIYQQKNKFSEAEKEYHAEMVINPLFHKSYYNLGILYYNQGHLDKTAVLWEKAVTLNPKFVQAHTNLAKLYLMQKQPQKAAVHIQELKKRGIAFP